MDSSMNERMPTYLHVAFLLLCAVFEDFSHFPCLHI